MAACTCSPCGRTFTGLTAFDKHQKADYSQRPAVTCLDPETLGMVQNARGRWGYPITDERREQLVALQREQDGLDAMEATLGPVITTAPALEAL